MQSWSPFVPHGALMTTTRRHAPRPQSRRKRRALELPGPEIRLTLPGVGEIDVEPDVEHTARTRWMGFADADECMAITEHVFDCFVERYRLEGDLPGLERSDSGLPRATGGEQWRAYMQPFMLAHHPEGLNDEHLHIARLEVRECPRIVCDALADGDWLRWLDAVGDDGRTGIAELVGEFTSEDNEQNEELGLEFPLLDGSLFWLRQLGVHPAFRGQRIGARLMAHAMWALHRAVGDLAVLEAHPTKTVFDAEEPTGTTVDTIARLVAYYERVGFLRSRPGQPIGDRAVAMHVQFGAKGLPVRGLPGLSP